MATTPNYNLQIPDSAQSLFQQLHQEAIDVDNALTSIATGGGTYITGLGDPAANGIVVRTGLGITIARTIVTASSPDLTVTNGDGLAGNPSIGLSSNIPRLNAANTFTSTNQFDRIGLMTSTPAALTGLYISQTALAAGNKGIDILIGGNTDVDNQWVAAKFATQWTGTGSSFHAGLQTVRAFTTHSGTGRVDYAIGYESVINNNAGGTLQEPMGFQSQIINSGASVIGQGYCYQADYVAVGTSSVSTYIALFKGKFRHLAGTTQTTNAIYGLYFTQWAKPTGTVTTSSVIEVDASVDVGTTRWMIHSTSLSDSLLQGGLGLGVAGTTKGILKFSGNTSGIITVQPAAAAGTWSLTLPTTGGTNGYFLKTDGAGITSWAAGVAGSGTINRVPKWMTSTALGDSQITEDGVGLSIGTGTSVFTVNYSTGDTTIGSISASGLTSFGNITDIGDWNGIANATILRIDDSTQRVTISGGFTWDVLNNSLGINGSLIIPSGGIGQYQNLLGFSEQFDNAVWVKTNVTVTPNSVTSPDLSVTADTLTSTVAGGSVAQTHTVLAVGPTFNFSVWLKASSTISVDLRIDGSTTGTGTAIAVTVTSSWQRFNVTQNTTGFTGTPKALIFPGETDGTGTVYAWGAQMSQSASPFVYQMVENPQYGEGGGASGLVESVRSGVVSNGPLYVQGKTSSGAPVATFMDNNNGGSATVKIWGQYASQVSFNSGSIGGSGLTSNLTITGQQHIVLSPGNNVGIGTTTPQKLLDVLSTTQAQLRLTYTNASVYTDFLTDSSGNLNITTSGPLLKFINTTRIQSSDYASQVTGWGITGTGEADFRFLYADQLVAKSFIADLEQALAGGQIICKSVAELNADFTVPTTTGGTNVGTLVIKDLPSAAAMPVFEANDIVRLRQFSRASGSLTITDCWGVVTAYVNNANGTQNWTFTRSLGALGGGATAGTLINAKTLALDYGTSGNGFYEVNAIDGLYGINSPYSQIVTWLTHPQNGLTIRTRLGNLKGLFGSAEYGLYAGDGVALTNKYIRITDTTVQIHNVPVELFDGSTKTIALDPTNLYFALGTTMPTSYLQASTTGIWMGKFAASDYRLRIGVVDGSGALTAGMTWNGTTLNVIGSGTFSGNITATSGNIAGWTINTASMTSGGVTLAASSNRPFTVNSAWFGKESSTAFMGWELRDTSDRVINALINVGSNYPRLVVHDGTKARVAMGGLNEVFNTGDTARASMGMKIFDSAGTMLSEFSNTQNVISGWTISAASISSGGITLAASATAANNKIYVGTGTFKDSATGFFVDGTGQLSLKDRFAWDGTILQIGNGPKNVVGGTFTDGIFTKTAADATWGNSGFSSVVAIVGDGYIEWTASESTTHRMIGLSTSDPDQNYASILYCWYTKVSAVLEIYESGTSTGYSGSYVANTTVFRINRTGTTLTYLKDGVVQRTVTSITSSPLYLDTSFYTINGTLNPVKMVQGTTVLGGTYFNGSNYFIAGTIAAYGGIISGVLNVNTTSGALAFGTTPPTSATVGTGLWLDRTGMYGLAANVLQAKFDAVTGAITAGGGNVIIDQNGVFILPGTSLSNKLSLGNDVFIYGLASPSSVLILTSRAPNTTTIGWTQIISQNSSASEKVQLDMIADSVGTTRAALWGSNFTGLILGVSYSTLPTAMLDIRGTSTITAMAATGQYFSVKYTLTDGATIAVDWNNGNVQYVVIGATGRTVTFSNAKDGARYLLIVKQDGTGSRTITTWPASVLWSGGTAPVLTTAANKVDLITFVYDGTNSKHYGSFALNF